MGTFWHVTENKAMFVMPGDSIKNSKRTAFFTFMIPMEPKSSLMASSVTEGARLDTKT